MVTRPHADLSALLAGYVPFDELEALHVKQLDQFLASTDNAYCRSNLLGHVVADAWILNRDCTKVLLIGHPVGNIWTAPGGHCDGSADTYAQALREAEEETGLNSLLPLMSGIFDVYVGSYPTRRKAHGIEPEHLHFHVCFAFTADETEVLQICDESTGLKWMDIALENNKNYGLEHARRVNKMRESAFVSNDHAELAL